MSDLPIRASQQPLLCELSHAAEWHSPLSSKGAPLGSVLGIRLFTDAQSINHVVVEKVELLLVDFWEVARSHSIVVIGCFERRM